MIAAGTAYYAYESKEELDAMREAAMAAGAKPRYDGAYRDRNASYKDDPNRVIRLKNPLDGVVAWDDKVKGRIEIANSELDDLVLFRPDGYPTYNFAVVVDDLDMKISDVVRGDDHVNNTPRQINIYRALGAEPPAFSHLPMILDEDGAKLSKRTGAADVMQFRDAGYLPHALLNYLVRLGWSHGDQEYFTREEMIASSTSRPSTPRLRAGSGHARWLNQQYLKTDDPADVASTSNGPATARLRHRAGSSPADVVTALRDRVQTLADMAERAAVWYRPLESYDDAAVAKHLTAAAGMPLAEAREQLSRLPSWSAESVGEALHAVAEALGLGMGKIAQPLRVAITGTQVSPDIAHTVYLAGRNEALKRIDAALQRVASA